MSKVHLIKDCYACMYRWCDLCVKAGTRINIDTYKDFPDWCPLPDLPEELSKTKLYKGELFLNIEFVDGWNACLDAITRE